MLLQKGFNKGYYTVEMRLARAPDAIYDLYDEIFQAIMLEELPQLKSDYHKKLEAWERKNERIKLARANKAQTEQDRRKAKGVARPAKKPERDITTPPALKVSFGLFCFHSSGFTQLTWCFRCFPAVVVYILLGIHNLPCVERRCYPTYLCAICLHSSGFTQITTCGLLTWNPYPVYFYVVCIHSSGFTQLRLFTCRCRGQPSRIASGFPGPIKQRFSPPSKTGRSGICTYQRLKSRIVAFQKFTLLTS